MSTLITDAHLNKPAYIYVRQSTLAQVRHNQESTERQYALRDKALALGWPQRSVRVLDRDLGQSGAQTSGREDFKTLVSDVAMGQVGAVFALEVSRLARSNLDWHRLLELCALTHTLVIDADGMYDPGDFNDGLLLGLKGTMAQAELHFLRGRLQGGKLNKARKGELRFPLPVGFCYDDQGRIVPDADDEVRGAVQLVFTLFRETGSAYAVVRRFAQSGLRFPRRAYGGAWAGKLIWGRLTHSRVLGLLKNPSYAGTYVFGRYQYTKSITADGEVRKNMRAMPTPDWRVHLPDHHEGYITVEEFEQNQQRLARNRTNGEGTVLSGAAREGLALLQGLLICGSCGRALTVRYRGNGGLYPIYECNWAHREALASVSCFSVRTDSLDEAICEEMFKALKPAELELALAAVDELEQRDQAVMRQWQMRIERAEYECALAERRYEEVDPANRLVAASLERRWNEALTRVDEVRAEAAKFQAQKTRVLTAEQRSKVLALARDLPRLWRAPTTETKDRKRMLRLLIADITVEDLRALRQVVLHIRWHGGTCSDVTVTRCVPIADRLRYPAETVERVRALSHTLPDEQIAQTLNTQGVPSSRGKPFTATMVKWIRYRYAIPAARLQRLDEVTVKQLAGELGVSIHFVHYWIKQGKIAARQIDGRGPWWITINAQQRSNLHDQIRNSVHFKNHLCEAKL
ncbi:recombinase family protein [Paraburkholderia sp. IMGN_8]|uniref:recombinase family protein n=1 Tax=Paraburkholderia sp. IMGN_8 TaxID=3136564 RepID=UPI0031011A57